ncbi:3-phosphoglycerate dehydrogenase [Advenella kashmirensis W13003]|uniref:3-phosphoglycerate dehydrogenase n=1 Tax=Advenella kashmirensis W13003 TaxID=1424334 RepID=V8QQE6_9BURK|nr:NAD(P)-dependent oxidoreductase [Advenella kashmirensis]ETF01515.1 3-phosphoglycerate dehydrogenase [Advenella kashmirensis W13003]
MSNNPPVILVTAADLAPQAVELLNAYELVFAGRAPQDDEIVALAKKHNPVGIIVRYGRVTAETMDAAPNLKVISKHGSGIDTIDQAAAQSRSITVVAALGVNAAAVAEQALALLLGCAKSLVRLNGRMHAGYWDKSTHKTLELRGRTIGIIGLGAIGQRFAKMADAIEMRVLGFDPYAKNVPSYIRTVDIQTIWQESDVISLHCPLTPENRELINAASLAQCKKGLILINTARGGLVDEDALLKALNSGHVFMAGLDSFAVEPFAAPHIFQGHERLLLSPHIGGVTSDAYINMGVAAARNVIAAVAA